MKKKKILPWLILLFSVAAMAALGVWNYYAAQQAIMQRHQAWVERLGVQLSAVRKHRLEEVEAWAPRAG